MDRTRSLTTVGLALLMALGFGLGAAPARAADKVQVPGFDDSGMTPLELASFHKLLGKFPSRCGKPHSLLVSIKTDPKCKRSVLAAREMGRMFKAGLMESEVEEHYADRFVKPRCFQIDIAGAMVKGDPKAPITVVEFSDFQCPHCKMAEPYLKAILEERKDVKLVFMNFPLNAHPQAPDAAAAALAAGKQGKFWAYHDKLFANQDRMSMIDLRRYAQELGLDLNRFSADLEGSRVRVQHERALGEKLELDGTPAFYVNGCMVPTAFKNGEGLRGMIEDEAAK